MNRCRNKYISKSIREERERERERDTYIYIYVSYRLNFLKGDYIGEYDRGY